MNFFRELQITMAKTVMVAGYRVARLASAWMARLVSGRPPDVVERMERNMGMRHD